MHSLLLSIKSQVYELPVQVIVVELQEQPAMLAQVALVLALAQRSGVPAQVSLLHLQPTVAQSLWLEYLLQAKGLPLQAPPDMLPPEPPNAVPPWPDPAPAAPPEPSEPPLAPAPVVRTDSSNPASPPVLERLPFEPE